MARNTAVAAALLLVFGAAIFVLSGHEENTNTTIIAEEETGCAELPIHADWNDALEGRTDTGDKCVKIRDEMVQQHDRFWSNVKCRLTRAFGKQKAAKLEAAFTAEVDALEAQMTKLHCAQTVGASAAEPAGCAPLRNKRLNAARSVKSKVEDMLLAKDPRFKVYLSNIAMQSKRLEARLARLDCAEVLASTPTRRPHMHMVLAHHKVSKAVAHLHQKKKMKAVLHRTKLKQAVKHHHKMIKVHEMKASALRHRVKSLKRQLREANGKLSKMQSRVSAERQNQHQRKKKLATDAAMKKQRAVEKVLRAKLKFQDSKIAKQKLSITHQQRSLADTLKSTEAALKRRRAKIAAHRAKANSLQKRIQLVKWGEKQTARLHAPLPTKSTKASHHKVTHAKKKYVEPKKLHPKKKVAPMPPVTTAPGASFIGAAFDEDFNKLESPEMEMSEVEKLKLKHSPSETKAAKLGAARGAPVSPHQLATALTKTTKASKSATKAKVTKSLAKRKPATKVAKATANAVAAVKLKVRSAARAAAKKAATKALKMGLSAKKTRALVRAAAQAAARKTAKRAHRVFQSALANAPTPGMMAAARMRIAKKELAHKAVIKKEKKKKQMKREAIESGNKAKRKSHAEQVFKRAAKRTAKAVAKGANKGVKNIKGLAKGEVSVAKGIKAAEHTALQAEAKAWVRAVGGATSKKDVMKGIKAMAQKHKVSLVKAASRWEARKVMKMRSRFARHFSKALALNPKKKKDREKAAHEADRERINAQKMVIARAEMQEIVAKKNQEKLAKSLLRAKNAGKRAKAAAAFALKKRLAQARVVDSRANSVQRKAISAVLAKDAEKAEKAEEEANAAKASANHANAAKEEALGALTVAQKKLTALSEAAAKGTENLSSKLRAQLKAQQLQMKGKIRQVKHDTAVAVAKKLSKVGKRVIAAKVAKAKAKLAAQASKKTHQAQKKASKVANAAMKAATSAKKLAGREAHVAARARSHSKELAAKAVKRAAAVQSMAAQQMERLTKQKKLALKHFQEFNTRLRALENEKSAKTEAKIHAKQSEANRATKAAARAARFAEQQMAAADLQKSQAVINRADTANAVLESAIYAVKTADARARGAASLEQEQQRVLKAKQRTLEKKKKSLTKAKEQKAKVALEVVERKKKAVARAKELHIKQVVNEKREKHARTAHEGFVKGVAFAKEKRAKRDAKNANVVAAHAAERKAKMMLRSHKKAAKKAMKKVRKAKKAVKKAARKAKKKALRALSPVQRQARNLVKHAVGRTQHAKNPRAQAAHEVASGNAALRKMVVKAGKKFVKAGGAFAKSVAKSSVNKAASLPSVGFKGPRTKKHPVKPKSSKTMSIVKRAINEAEHSKGDSGAAKATSAAIKAMVAGNGN